MTYHLDSMVEVEAFSELLEILYSAPLDASQWERFLTRICECTQSKNALFLCADSKVGLTLRAIGGTPHDIQVATVYNQRYAGADPFRPALICRASIGVFQGDDVLPNLGLLRTALYQELCKPLGVRYATLIALTLSIRRFEAMSVWRAPEDGPMHEDCNGMLRLLVPHVQKALEIHRVLGVTQQRLAGAEAIADASSTAAFLLTGKGYVVHRNAAASELLSEEHSLNLHDGVLTTTRGDARDALRNLVSNASSLDVNPSSSKAPNALALLRAGEGPPLQLLAVPLQTEVRARTGADVMLLATDPQRTPAFPDGLLRALYALTQAETEIANGLLMGYSVQEIASLRRVTQGTVRLQIKSLLSKTGTQRQSDLVRLLMTLPQAVSK